MEAYHIDRFGSVDGIVLRSNEDPRPGPSRCSFSRGVVASARSLRARAGSAR